MQFRRILALAPHTDDAELGCGGTLARLVDEGAEVYIAAFSTAEESVPEGSPRDRLQQEFLTAAPLLGVPVSNLIVYGYPVRRLSYYRQEVLDELIRLRNALQPELILLPSGDDVHQDHQVIYAEGIRAFKNGTVLGYELPWNHISFTGQAFVVLDKTHVDRKWEALSRYKSQFEMGRPYFKREFIDGLARVRGAQVHTEWAEAFEVTRVKFPLQ